MMHTVHRGLRALPANFSILRGVGCGESIPCPGISHFGGKGVGAVTSASLAEKKQGCGQGCHQV